METKRLYYDDAYRTAFDARVTEARADGWVALDQSAFYPTSGGQPFDTGVLEAEGRAVRVVDVQVEAGVVWHRVEALLPVGAAVHGSIDWDRRWDHMQQHAGDHLLAGAIAQLYGGVTLGLHTGAVDSSIDVHFPGGQTKMSEEEILSIETLVNRRVQQDDPIRCFFPDPAALPTLNLRKQPTVREHVRVVMMGDYEAVPCGGTHPSTTGQIGPVKILSCAPARGNVRVTFLAGMRAVRYFQAAARCACEVSALLSAQMQGAADALRREREGWAALRRGMNDRLTDAALMWIRREGKQGVWEAHVPFADPETLLRAAAALTQDGAAVALLSCPQGDRVHLAFARGENVQADMAQLMRDCGARGGGKPDLARGSAADGEALARAGELLRARMH